MPFNEDIIEIVTPERVNLDFPIAGIGSRFAATAFDLVAIAALYLTVNLLFFPLLAGTFSESEYLVSFVAAIQIAIQFILFTLYFAGFEYFWNGQTPGKRLLKIRVMRYGGLPVDFNAVMIRNLMRLVDVLLFAMAIGFLILFLSKLTQRPGDYVAGTIVVRDRHVSLSDLEHYLRESSPENKNSAVIDRRFSKLGAEDIKLIELYISKSDKMTSERRREIAEKIAGRICQKLNIKPDEFPSEEKLIIAAMESIENMQDKW